MVKMECKCTPVKKPSGKLYNYNKGVSPTPTRAMIRNCQVYVWRRPKGADRNVYKRWMPTKSECRKPKRRVSKKTDTKSVENTETEKYLEAQVVPPKNSDPYTYIRFNTGDPKVFDEIPKGFIPLQLEQNKLE